MCVRERNAIIKPEILVTHRILVALRIVESLPNAVALDSVAPSPTARISMSAPSTMVDARCELATIQSDHSLVALVPVVTISSTTSVSTLTSASSHPACVRLGPSTVSTRLEATIARVIQRHTLKLPMVAALTLTSVKPLPRFVAPWSASTQKAASVADRVPVDRSPLKESVCVSGMNDEH